MGCLILVTIPRQMLKYLNANLFFYLLEIGVPTCPNLSLNLEEWEKDWE